MHGGRSGHWAGTEEIFINGHIFGTLFVGSAAAISRDTHFRRWLKTEIAKLLLQLTAVLVVKHKPKKQ